jgi:hypothetical protein
MKRRIRRKYQEEKIKNNKKDKTKKLGRKVAPVYTLMFAPNGFKKAWLPGKTPRNYRYVLSLICMSVIQQTV